MEHGTEKKARVRFRFEDMAIWQRARDLAVQLHRVSEGLDAKHYYKYAEQLRSAALSVTNNIAEGSGSVHVREFQQFLNIARRSLFENASMLLVLEAMGLWKAGTVDGLLTECDELSRMVLSFNRTLQR